MKRDGKTPVAPQNPRNHQNRPVTALQKSQKTANRSHGATSIKAANNFWASLSQKSKSRSKKSSPSKQNTITGSNRVKNSPHKQNIAAATMRQNEPPKVARNRPKSSFYKTGKLAFQVVALALGVSTIFGTLI